MPSTVTTPTWPRILPREHRLTLRVDDQPVEILAWSSGCFARAAVSGAATVDVAIPAGFDRAEVVVRPLSRSIAVTRRPDGLSLPISGPGDLVVEIDGLPQLTLIIDAPAAEIPAGPKVRRFAGSQVHEVGLLEVGAGETVFLEDGAVLRGAIRAEYADGARICGRGLIDNRYFERGRGPAHNPVLVSNSRNVTVSEILLIEPQTWSLKIAGCEDCVVEKARILGDLNASDGIDIVGSSRIQVRGCFVRSNDDCLAVKAVEYGTGDDPERRRRWCADCHDIDFGDCILYSYGGGSAMEIGHEFRCDLVENVRFHDIDILAVHQYGSAFSIRNADGAVIRNVTYERIRVEHHYNELIGFRILRSRYSRSAEPGRAENIVLRDCDIAISIYNPGYTVSHCGGPAPGRSFHGVRFDQVRLNGKVATCIEDLDLYTRHATDISFA